MFSIYRLQKYFGTLSNREAFKLFDSIVQPILCYSSELRGFRPSKTVAKVHVNFCKHVACLNTNAADFFALSECGRYLLYVTYMSRCAKYWTKLTRMEQCRYPKQCYDMLRHLDDANRTTWATHIKGMLFEYGFGYAWINNGVGDVSCFMLMLKTRLRDCTLQRLQQQIIDSITL